MYLQCSESFPKICQLRYILGNLMEHLECATQEHFRFIILVYFKFPNREHCGHTGWKTARKTLIDPFENIMGTSFGNILSVPENFLIGMSQSHHLEHLKCTGHFPSGEIARKMAWKIPSVPAVYQVGIMQLLCPCPCSVPVMYQVGTTGLTPSE